MATPTSFVPASELLASEAASASVLPRGCTFTATDWQALAPFWYPVAFAHEVTDKPYAARLLDERVVVYRLSDGGLAAARDICFHRGVPLSMGRVEGDEIICKYHGLRDNKCGECTLIPAQPGSTSSRLRLKMYESRERYGLVWVRLSTDREVPFPDFSQWDDPSFIQVLPNAVKLSAAAGRQVEGFLDVSHFAFIHQASFGETSNAEVPNYPVEITPGGFRADYVSTVSNYPTHLKHLNPPGFKWRRLFEVFLPFTAKLTVTFPNGTLAILNAASPISARKTKVFCPVCRDFDKGASPARHPRFQSPGL